MSSIVKAALPAHAHLWTHFRQGDFIDGYATHSDLTPRQALERGLSMPWWADKLLGLRNMIVRPFGLKTEISDASDSGGIFPITHESECEVVVGTNDKHLDFRISVLRHDGKIHMATWVHPHNLAGKAYLKVVMPFHVLITRNAVRNMV